MLLLFKGLRVVFFLPRNLKIFIWVLFSLFRSFGCRQFIQRNIKIFLRLVRINIDIHRLVSFRLFLCCWFLQKVSDFCCYYNPLHFLWKIGFRCVILIFTFWTDTTLIRVGGGKFSVLCIWFKYISHSLWLSGSGMFVGMRWGKFGLGWKWLGWAGKVSRFWSKLIFWENINEYWRYSD